MGNRKTTQAIIVTQSNRTPDQELEELALFWPNGNPIDLNSLGSGEGPGGLATVATTGEYSDLLNKPILSSVAETGAYTDLTGRPSLSTVATTGAYNDLTGRPSLHGVATSGQYSSLVGLPTLGTAAAQASTAFEVSGAASAVATASVAKSLYDANTVLIATTDNTPVALTVPTSTIVGRKASGAISALTAAELRAILAINRKYTVIHVTDPAGDAIITGEGKALITIGSQWSGYNIVSVETMLTTVSSSGNPTVQIARIRGGTPVDVCSTAPVIDASEFTSSTGIPAVINATNDDLLTGDLIRIDVDVAGTGAKGLQVILGLELP